MLHYHDARLDFRAIGLSPGYCVADYRRREGQIAGPTSIHPLAYALCGLNDRERVTFETLAVKLYNSSCTKSEQDKDSYPHDADHNIERR